MVKLNASAERGEISDRIFLFGSLCHRCGLQSRRACSDFSSRGAKGEDSPVGRTQVRDPTAKPEVGRGLLDKGDLGPAALGRSPCAPRASMESQEFATPGSVGESSQVKLVLSTQIQNSPLLAPGTGSLRRREN